MSCEERRKSRHTSPAVHSKSNWLSVLSGKRRSWRPSWLGVTCECASFVVRLNGLELRDLFNSNRGRLFPLIQTAFPLPFPKDARTAPGCQRLCHTRFRPHSSVWLDACTRTCAIDRNMYRAIVGVLRLCVLPMGVQLDSLARLLRVRAKSGETENELMDAAASLSAGTVSQGVERDEWVAVLGLSRLWLESLQLCKGVKTCFLTALNEAE